MTLARVREERGVTLVELLCGMLVSLIVIFSTMSIADTAFHSQAKTLDRLGTTQRGRLAMDRISSQLRTRICLDTDVTSLVSAGDDQVEFYASYAPASVQRVAVQRRRLTYRPATNDVLEEVWVATPPTEPPMLPPPATDMTNKTTRVVATGVAPSGATPFFRYYAYQGAPPRADLRLATPLVPTDRPRTVVIDVTFEAVGNGSGTETRFSQQIYNRSPSCDVFT